MEIVGKIVDRAVKAVLFDFDGTISTLRHGWESVMEPMMIEMIAGNAEPDGEIVKRVREYIDESTGIQTIHQMKWLAEEVRRQGRNPGMPADPWWYKAEYNRRLMLRLADRKAEVLSGKKRAEEFLMAGAEAFLQELCARGVKVYVASGTDDADVAEEAELLGVRKYFTALKGAMPGSERCSKEETLRMLAREAGLQGAEMAVFGDGKVEIALGAAMGALTVGVASDEEARHGINRAKRSRLLKAHADVIVGDFLEREALMKLLGMGER
ncbi:MAG: HAD family hydrolase [Eubacteriales bacterium]|nr:HAD family hydrolase [Eubacteriales bacterium]